MRLKHILSLTAALTISVCSLSCSKNDNTPVKSVINDSPSRQVTLEVAVLTDCPQYITDTIEAFKRKNSDISVNLTNYCVDEDFYGIEGTNQLTRDMIAGSIPDIIIGQPLNLIDLQRNGYLADLLPLMESEGTLSEDDLLPNVREAVDVDGTIPYLFDCFTYVTYICGADTLGKNCENWTPSEAIATYNSFEKKEDLLPAPDKQIEIWDYFLGVLGEDCIDFESGTCDFSGAFRETIEFLSALPEQEYESEEAVNFGSHSPLIWSIIPDIGGMAAYSVYGNFNGEDISYIGFPSVSGNGAECELYSMYGIPQASSEKETAWKLLSEFFTLSAQKNMSLRYCSGIPVTMSAVNALAYDTPSYIGESVSGTIHMRDGQEAVISDEALGRLLDYTQKVNINLQYTKKLERIIRDEILAVYYGKQSVDACIENLNAKVGTYLSERQ